MNRFHYIKYTIAHRKSFRKVEKELFGRNSMRGYLHDLDKVFLYLLFGKRIGSKIHRRYSRHHERMARTTRDYEQMVIDWECARFTKPDKPLNAYDTLYRYYPKLEPMIVPILKRVNLA